MELQTLIEVHFESRKKEEEELIQLKERIVRLFGLQHGNPGFSNAFIKGLLTRGLSCRRVAALREQSSNEFAARGRKSGRSVWRCKPIHLAAPKCILGILKHNMHEESCSYCSPTQDERTRKEEEEAKRRAEDDAKKKKTLTSLHFGGYMQKLVGNTEQLAAFRFGDLEAQVLTPFDLPADGKAQRQKADGAGEEEEDPERQA